MAERNSTAGAVLRHTFRIVGGHGAAAPAAAHIGLDRSKGVPPSSDLVDAFG